MPMRQGEDLAEFEARLKTDYERTLSPAKSVTEMTEPERATALAALSRPAPYVPQMPPDLAEKRVDMMNPDERRRAARALGISHLVSSR